MVNMEETFHLDHQKNHNESNQEIKKLIKGKDAICNKVSIELTNNRMCKSGGNNNSPSIFVSTSRGSEIMKMS
jgi:hypothetical protein